MLLKLRSVIGVILVATVLVGLRPAILPAQDQKTPKATANTKRLTVTAQYRPVGDLAAALTTLFKGATDLQLLPDSPSNAMLVSGNTATVDEVIHVLARLDRRPQELTFEILILCVASRKGADGKIEPSDLDDKEFTGPAAGVLETIKVLEKKGAITSSKRLQLKAVENQTAHLKDTGNKPYVTGLVRTARAGGGPSTTRTLAYRTVGTTITLTPLIGADSVISLQLKVNDDRMQPDDRVAISTDENGLSVSATEFVSAVLDTNLQLTLGQAVLARDVRMHSKAAGEQTLIVVTAQLVK